MNALEQQLHDLGEVRKTAVDKLDAARTAAIRAAVRATEVGISPRAIAELTGLAPGTVRKYCADVQLPKQQRHHVWRFDRSGKPLAKTEVEFRGPTTGQERRTIRNVLARLEVAGEVLSTAESDYEQARERLSTAIKGAQSKLAGRQIARLAGVSHELFFWT